MRVHYVFVGQGAGAIVELPCGVAVVDVGGEYAGGADDVDGGQLFYDYLTGFFADHPQYHDTVDVVFLSHPHQDHINGLKRFMDPASPIKFKAVADNGQTGDRKMLKLQSDFRQWVDPTSAHYTAVEFARQTTATGVTNAVIDPFDCATVTAFWGGLNEAVIAKPEYASPNNHSVLVRFDFGEASFLFMGDLQDQGAGDLMEEYAENLGVFDVDVFQVSHHGADGDTSDALIGMFSPQIAVISMGTKASNSGSSAYGYGHPRDTTLAQLQEQPDIVTDTRTPAAYWTSTGKNKGFDAAAIDQAIYGTGWEGTVIVTATAAGTYDVVTLGDE